MDSLGEKGSRLLDEAAEVCDLLRLAHSAVHRMQRELHGESYELALELSHQLHRLRDECNRYYDLVNQDVENLQKDIEAL